MAVSVDRAKFDQAHEAFLKHMLKMGEGVPFTGFGHRFFREDEWEWKHRVRNEASEALQLRRWVVWQRSPWKIVQAVKACAPAERGGSREGGPFLGALPSMRYRPVAEPPQSGEPASV